VDGQSHTNGMENFWSLLKGGLNATHVSVEPFLLFRYIDEQAFLCNNRKDMKDADRVRSRGASVHREASDLGGAYRQGD